MRISLVSIQNHQYLGNLEKIDRLYGHRFDDLVHLVPFARAAANVIPVFGNSRYFSGYIAQAARDLLRLDADYYAFVADDLILNPLLNANSLGAELSLIREDACFFPQILEFESLPYAWHRADEAAAWSPQVWGVEAEHLLPTPDEARAKFSGHGIRGDLVSGRSMMKPQRDSSGQPLDVILDFPLAGGLSDFFVVARPVLEDFAVLCGIFAATNLFVEVAIPTALILAAPELSTQADTVLRGRYLWGDQTKELDVYEQDLNELNHHFPDSALFLHPVKVSQWTI